MGASGGVVPGGVAKTHKNNVSQLAGDKYSAIKASFKWPSKRQDALQNAILDPVIILASISDRFVINFELFVEPFSDVFGPVLECIFVSSFPIDFG